MNRKEASIVVILLLISFFGGVYGAATTPAITNVFVTNFPRNQNVTVTNFPQPSSTTVQTTGVDLEILSSVPGIFIGPPSGNLTSGFAFIAHQGFVQVTSALLTIEWSGTISQGHIGDQFSIQLNGQSTLSASMLNQATILTPLPSQGVRVGSNQINISVVPANPGTTTNYLLYEVRLTLQYTFNS